MAETSIHTAQLANGLKVVCEEMPWLPSVSFDVTVPVGAATDPVGHEGAASVLHEWVQRGAGAHSSRGLSDALDALGVRRSGDAGVETSSWGGSLLADALPDALRLYASMLQEPRLETSELKGARLVAAEELASLEDNPSQRMFLALSDAYFASGHGRSPYGSEAGLAALTAESLREDFRARVGPEGAILSIAGGVRWHEVFALAVEVFGGWTGLSRALPDVALKPPHHHHETADTAQQQIGVAFKAVAPGETGWYENALGVSCLGGGMSSRLFSEVREKRGLVYAVAAVNRAVKGHGYTLGYAGTTPERAATTLEVLLHELTRLRDGVSAEELTRAKTGMLSSLVMQAESSSARAGALARDVFLLGRPRGLEEIKTAVAGIGLAELNTFLATRAPQEFTVVTLGPGAEVAA